MTDADKMEIKHIAEGGKWCLDGRKERKLARLGFIEAQEGKYGWFVTEKGLEILGETQ